MKKISFFLILCLFASTFAMAQKKEVRNANRALKNNQFAVAKEAIDKAIQDPTTMNDPDTWVLRTNIYMGIAGSEDPAVKALDLNALVVAYEAVTQAKKLDVTNKNILKIQQTFLVLSEAFYNEAAIAYNDGNFKRASDMFMQSFNVSGTFGSVDTATLYNAGLSAELGQYKEQAVDIYLRVEALGYNQPYLYSSLNNLYLAMEMPEEAQKWITVGRERFPENLDLVFSEANLYLATGNSTEARRVLQIAIDRDPDNANLYYAYGVNFDQMANDTTRNAEDRKFAYEEAVKSYKKAIELEPKYFDAYYNLGALLFNEGIRMFIEAENQLRKDMNFRAYDAKEKLIREQWLKSQPYLEKCKEMITDLNDPNYELVLRSLRELYLRTNQEEKFEITNKLWKEKFGGQED